MIIDYTVAVECENPEVYYTCWQCGKCGRKFENGIRIKKSYSDKLNGNLPYGMDENDWNKLMADWASELNQLEMKLEECNPKSKVLYNRLNLIMAFCNQLPELFRFATPEIKREIVQTCIRTLSYNGETLKIELFPIFYKLKYWKKVKNGAPDGIRTHAYRNHNPRS